MITYRRADPDDVEEMFRLDKICFESPFRFARETFDYLMDQAGIIALVAEEDGGEYPVLAGFIIVEPELEGLACVCTIDVHPTYRRARVGTELMGRAADAVAAAGLSKMYLHVYVDNVSAKSFYEGLGYRELSRVRSFYGPGRHALIMEKAVETVSDGR